MAYVSVNCGTAGTGGEVWPGDGGTGGQERGVARVGTGDGGTGDRWTGDLSPPRAEAEAGSTWHLGNNWDLEHVFNLAH